MRGMRPAKVRGSTNFSESLPTLVPLPSALRQRSEPKRRQEHTPAIKPAPLTSATAVQASEQLDGATPPHELTAPRLSISKSQQTRPGGLCTPARMAEFSRLVVPKAPRTIVEGQQQKESTYWRSFRVRTGISLHRVVTSDCDSQADSLIHRLSPRTVSGLPQVVCPDHAHPLFAVLAAPLRRDLRHPAADLLSQDEPRCQDHLALQRDGGRRRDQDRWQALRRRRRGRPRPGV